jgi:23S rRNA (uracil1939-C5)-methyltransferase
MTFGPSAIARVAGKSVLIPAAVPGDVLDLEIEVDRRDYALGSILRVLQPAPDRRQPPCPYASRCGGCDWQHIRYDAQVMLKGQVLAAEFRRALGIALDPSELVEPAPTEFHYRSRVRLQTGPDGKIGFRHQRNNSFVAIEDCLIAAPAISTATRFAFALGRNCKEIEVVAGPRGEVLIAHLTKPPGAFERKLAHQIIDNGAAGVILRGSVLRELFGEPQIVCEVEPGCIIEAEADVFSQINHAQNVKLVDVVMHLAEPSAETRMLDLFCGAGNFSLPAARRGADLIGMDRDELAIAAARANAKRMGLERTQFIAMGAEQGVRFLRQTGYRPQVLILDPPRAGAANAIGSMVRLNAPRLIYVSCNLSTLVRDLRQLILRGYEVRSVRGFDFFPNTHHIEIVASLLLT